MVILVEEQGLDLRDQEDGGAKGPKAGNLRRRTIGGMVSMVWA